MKNHLDRIRAHLMWKRLRYKGSPICVDWQYNFLVFKDWYFQNCDDQANVDIKRIDESKEYGPQNCRLVTRPSLYKSKRRKMA